MNQDQQLRLERVAVFGSKSTHLCVAGQQITLCGRLASGKRIGLSTKPRCRRCENDAFAHGATVTP